MKRCACTKTKGRPPAGAKQVERLTKDGWVLDDGEPGMAFSGLADRLVPYAWYGKLYCLDPGCPSRQAMNRTCDRFGAANGALFGR